MRRLSIGCLLVLVFTISSSAQVASLKCLSKPYEWSDPPEMNPDIPELVALENADILVEDLRVSFLRSKPEFLTVVFERHLVLRFGTREAVDEHARFILPESFDPASDYQDVAWEERDSLPRPLYFETRLEQFNARVIGPVNRSHEIEVDGRLITQRKKTGDRFFRAYSYDLSIPGVAPGDTVEVIYKYTVPFENNWFKFNSNKHFFNGKLHKHRYQLRVDATLTQGFNLHGAPPDSISVTNKKRIAYWRLEDLRASTDEVNARLHADLPYIVYGTAVNSDLYMHGHVVSTSLGGIPYMYSNIPYWVSILRMREAKAPAYRRLALKRIGIDAQTRKVRDWTNGFGGVELHPVEKALRAHNRIARDFSFQWDDAWYDNEDMSLLKPGDLLFEKTLREIGRYNQYSKLLSTLRLRYETIYLHDKRAGVLDKNYLTDLWENEMLFQLVDDGRRFYFHPKGRRGGYFVNELPFYWEGTSGLLADIDMLWSNNPKTPEFSPLGTSPPSSNSRHTQVKVHVDEDNDMELSAQILLKGQFSTMTRDAYLYGERDSTIMPYYGRRYLHDDSRIDLIDGPSEQHPFTTDISLSAVLIDRVEMSDDGSAVLNLIDFFPFLIPAGFNAGSRDLPFYWDFLQQDRYSVELFFDYDVQVEEQDLRYGSIDLGTQLHFSVTQTSSASFIVSAALLVTAERVPAGRANDLQEVFEAAHKVKYMEVKIPISD